MRAWPQRPWAAVTRFVRSRGQRQPPDRLKEGSPPGGEAVLGNALELTAASLGATIAISSLALIALADGGRFHPAPAVGAIAGAAALSLVLFQPFRAPLPSLSWAGILALLALVACAALVAPGSEHIAGPRDPGVYAATAFQIARGGGVLFFDPALQFLGLTIEPGLQNAWLFHGLNDATVRFPGQVFVRDLRAGLVEPGFLPALPAWMALAERLGGPEPALHVSGAFGVLALLYLALTARALGRSLESDSLSLWERVGVRAVGGAWGVAPILLAVSFPHVWWSRETMAETTLATFSWMAAWACLEWARGGGARRAVLAALAAIAALFSRADGVLVALPVGLALLLLGAPGGRWGLAVLGGGAAGYLGQVLAISPIYARMVYGPFTLERGAGGAVAAGLIVAATIAALRRLPAHPVLVAPGFPLPRAGGEGEGAAPGDDLTRRCTRWRIARRVLVSGAVAAAAVALVADLGPGVGRDAILGAASPLVWLPDYVPAPWLLLSGVGMLALGWHGAPRGALPALLIGALPLLLYLPDPLVTGDHPWLSRRLAPAAIPFLALVAGLGFSALLRVPYPPRAARTLATAAAVGLVAASVGFSAAQVWPLASGPRHGAGILDSLTTVRDAVPPSAIVVFAGSEVGTELAMPLQALHGTWSFVAPSPAISPEVGPTLERWARLGLQVYWATEVAEPEVLYAGIGLELTMTRDLQWLSGEGSPRAPVEMQNRTATLFLYRVTPSGPRA